MTIDEFFEGRPESRRIYDALERELLALGGITVHASKSQIAFRRHHTVALAWCPDRYLRGDVAPLVLTLSFAKPLPSDRWKEVVQISPGHFTHHLELNSPAEVDEEVRQWLGAAWAGALP